MKHNGPRGQACDKMSPLIKLTVEVTVVGCKPEQVAAMHAAVARGLARSMRSGDVTVQVASGDSEAATIDMDGPVCLPCKMELLRRVNDFVTACYQVAVNEGF